MSPKQMSPFHSSLLTLKLYSLLFLEHNAATYGDNILVFFNHLITHKYADKNWPFCMIDPTVIFVQVFWNANKIYKKEQTSIFIIEQLIFPSINPKYN